MATSLALAALVIAGPTDAQNSVNDYQLPPQPTQGPVVQGPVDTEVPAPSPPASTPAPAPASTPATRAAPRITLPVIEREAPRAPAREAAARREQAAPTAPPAPVPDTTGAAQAEALPQAPIVTPPSPATPESAPPRNFDWRLPALLGAIALIGLGALLWWRRRPHRAAKVEETQEAPDSAATASAPAALTPLDRSPSPPKPSRVVPTPSVAGPLDFRLEPLSLRLSVVYATLSYQLHVGNVGDRAFAALRLAGDLISAHASIPTAQQLLPDEGLLQPQHEIVALMPGESVALKGELRLPLSEVFGLRAGQAILFAPLARFVCRDDGGLDERRIFSIGQPSERPGDTMQPFRVDLGPMLFREVEQRPIDVSRWLPVDQFRRAG